MQTYKSILIEAVAASAVGIALTALLAPEARGLGLATLYPHPMWLAVVILAARYGGRGLAVAAPMAWGTLALAALALRVPVAAVLARLSTGSDLGALIAVVLVSWIASVHERRTLELARQLAEVKQRCAADQAALAELRRVALTLRGRADRLDTSLTFLRDVAQRLDGGDADTAAEAALDLVMARLGARAAVLEVVGPGGLTPLASAGVWGPAGAEGGLGSDRTAAMALRARRPARAVDLPDGGPEDSDLAAPILDDRGVLCGVLAVRGVPQGGASASGLRDLAIIAGWVARAVARARPERDASADVAAAALEPQPDAGLAEPPPGDGEIDDGSPAARPRTISQINA